jgi:hypothetical protein
MIAKSKRHAQDRKDEERAGAGVKAIPCATASSKAALAEAFALARSGARPSRRSVRAAAARAEANPAVVVARPWELP